MIAVIVNPRSRANRRNPAHRRRVPGDRSAIAGACWRPRRWRSWTPWRAELHQRAARRHRRARRRRNAAQDGDRAGPGFRRRAAAADRHPVRRHDERRGDVAAASASGRGRSWPRSPRGCAPGRPLETMRRRCLRIGDKLGLPVRQRAARQLPGRILRRPGGQYGPGTRGLAADARVLFGAVAWAVRAQLFRRFKGTRPRRRPAPGTGPRSSA